LVAGGLMPIIALAAISTVRLPTTPIILLLSFDMARGALDNYAANQRITDFSWGASLWAEIALLLAALAIPGAGTVLTVFAAAISIIETLRSLGRFLRGWNPRPAVPAVKQASPAER
jgi:hypothetical protein